MSRLQVDPKLFVTCRLCLEDTGQYQIDPTVQNQIKYCFDIHVESYDGLPQLICQKCETQLSEYYKLKEIYTQKQEKLKSALIPKDLIQPQQDDVSSSQFNEQEISEHIERKRARKRNRILSQSSSSSDNDSPTTNKIRKKSTSSRQSDSSLYETKKYGCRLCHSYFDRKADVFTHLNDSHKKLKNKFKHILNNHCTVKLIKEDKLHNPSKIMDSVVISSDKIIKGKHPNYYVIYYTKDIVERESTIVNEQQEIKCDVSQLSHCTEETVVVDDNDDANNNENNCDEILSEQEQKQECIDLDDSSSEGSDTSKMVISRKMRVNNSKSINDISKTVQNIVSICQSRYRNKKSVSAEQRSSSPDTESQLQRKVLNIGRKSLYKQGFKCTGLLRYLEHKNLEILWFQKVISDTEPSSNVIHINTKLKLDKVDHNAGWAPFYQGKQGNSSSPFDVVIPDYPVENSEEDTKLLNTNPVRNPKQLPKKNIETENQNSKIKTYSKAGTSKNNTVKVEEDSFSLPVITSTTSLAPSKDTPILSVDDNNPQLLSNSQHSIVAKPKIRVKSDLELMSHKVLMSRNQIQNMPNQIVCQNQIQDQFNTSNIIGNNTKLSMHQPEPLTAVSSTSIEYVILDTVDFPNTKTDSPFDYIRKLLNMYNIILLETTEVLTPDYVCLIKFKVCYKQELKDSVVLCLSLHCKYNKFCIKVQDKKTSKYRYRCIKDIPSMAMGNN